MPGAALRVLLVEDDPDDHLITRKLLAAVPGEPMELSWSPTFDGALDALERVEFDVLLVDYRLGARTGIELIQEARARYCTTPVVVLTGMGDRALDRESMRSGAADFISKADLTPHTLGRAVRHAADRHRAGQASARLAAVVESSNDAICTLGADWTVDTWNPAAERTYGYTAAEMVGQPIFRLWPADSAEALRTLLESVLRGGQVEGVEVTQVRRDGRRIFVWLSLAPVRNSAGRVRYVSMIARDVTERKRLEEQYRQAQKLEVVGRLAGGVAHDFNNLLTAIRGTAQLMLADLPAGSSLRDDLLEIIHASERAAALTRQLLAFGRLQPVQPRVVDLNAVVAGTDRLLRKLIGVDVELATVLSPVSGSVRVDPVQVEQVLTNLVLNARDAMPAGGRLVVQTQAVTVAEGGDAAWPGLASGGHVMLAVSDDGEGMDAETRERCFEPFYTTKAPGQGTGLGLASVYGIVQQSGGHVVVHSAPGEGTTFQVFFPRVPGSPDGAASHAAPSGSPGGTETVLLVEDELPVRALVRRVLSRRGYAVLEAADGEEGLRTWRENRARVALVITDMVMPLMGGREMLRRIREESPGLPAIFMSGYTSETVIENEESQGGAPFLPKPFDVGDLLALVHRVLHEARR